MPLLRGQSSTIGSVGGLRKVIAPASMWHVEGKSKMISVERLLFQP